VTGATSIHGSDGATPRRRTAAAQPALAAVLLALAIGAVGSAAAADGVAAPYTVSRVAPRSGAKAPAKAAAPLVDINSASRERLKALPGIDDASAARIVAGRPWLSKAELVTEKAIPAGVYQSIRKSIVAVQKMPPRAALAQRATRR
jgi:DNA uptake protein ComE-like DNA-binding protein